MFYARLLRFVCVTCALQLLICHFKTSNLDRMYAPAILQSPDHVCASRGHMHVTCRTWDGVEYSRAMAYTSKNRGLGRGWGKMLRHLQTSTDPRRLRWGWGGVRRKTFTAWHLRRKNETHPGVGLSLMLGEVLTVSGTVKPAQVREYGGGWGVGSTEMLKVHWFSPTTSENIGVEWGWRWWGGTVALTAKTLRKSCSLLVSSAIGPAKSKSSFFEMA